MRALITTFLIVMVSVACRDIIELDLREQSGRVVIEALCTDQPGENWVKVSRSLTFFDTSNPPEVTDAIVELFDENGQLIELLEYDETAKLYKSTAGLQLLTGETYTLHVTVDNEIYENTSKLIENGQLDSLYYFFVPELFFRPEGYYVYVDGRIPKDEERYFRWLIYVNDTLKNERFDYFIFDNSLIRDTIRNFELPYALKAQDSVKLEMYTLTRPMFDYYNELVGLLFNDGGVFSPPPVNPTTNIRNITNEENYPLGFVQFSALVREHVFIDEDPD